MIGIPYNPNNCIFITSQTLNADQFNQNVPASGNKTTHNMLWDTANRTLIWVDTATNLIVFEIGGGGLPFGNDIGVVNAYQTLIPGSTLTDGYAFEVKIANTNTGASTLQINALGVLPFVDLSGDPLTAGMLEAGSIYIATYNSTFGGYQLLGEAKPGVAISNNVIPKGNGVSIVDGSWSFTGNDIVPNVYVSNIGSDTKRIGTIFMASNIDYANNLIWKSGGIDYMILTTAGRLGVGVIPTAKVDIKGEDATDANYSLKAGDIAGNAYLCVRNDGYVGLNGFTAPIGGEFTTTLRLRVFDRLALGSAFFVPGSYSLESGGSLYWTDGNQIDGGGIGLRFRAPGDRFQFSNQALNYDLIVITQNASEWTPNTASALTPTTEYDMIIKSSYWNGAIGVQNYANIKNTAMDTIGNYKLSLWVGGLERMSIKNNGQVNISSLPLSSVGLVSGDLWNNLGVVNIVP